MMKKFKNLLALTVFLPCLAYGYQSKDILTDILDYSEVLHDTLVICEGGRISYQKSFGTHNILQNIAGVMPGDLVKEHYNDTNKIFIYPATSRTYRTIAIDSIFDSIRIQYHIHPIKVIHEPEMDIAYPDTVCMGEDVAISLNSGLDNFMWSYSTGLAPFQQDSIRKSITYTNVQWNWGSINFWLQTEIEGCIFKKGGGVAIINPDHEWYKIPVDFYMDTEYSGEKIKLSLDTDEKTSQHNNISWKIGQDTFSGHKVETSLENGYSYDITLYVTTNTGCEVTSTKTRTLALGAIQVGTGESIAIVFKDSEKVYPNPAANTIHIDGNWEQGEYHLQVLDLGGKPFLTKRMENKSINILDTSMLPSGTYLFQISDNKQYQSIHKVIIN
jgi:hypothetical protein